MATNLKVLMGTWGSGGLLEVLSSRTWLRESGHEAFGQAEWRVGDPAPMFKHVKGMLSITRSTNTQKDGMKSHSSCTKKFAAVCMLPLCRLQLLSRPPVSQYSISITYTCRWQLDA
eukprot:scaffold26104_cov20-Tisochrysis_lutea.AAC.2